MIESINRAAWTHDAATPIHREIGARLLERLELIRITPHFIVDIGCGTGITSIALRKKYPKAQVIGLDMAWALLARARQRASWFRKSLWVCSDTETLPLRDASCDLLFSNLALHWCNDLDQTLQEFKRILKPEGLLLFSTLGPDTLIELRQSWRAADAFTHVNAFIDMHDIGDALIRARFADPVMDVERLTLTYRDVYGLMADLKNSGARNFTAGRPRSLTGKQRLQTMLHAYEQFRRDGRLPATYEIVYGHAWQTAPTATRQPGIVTVPLSQLRRRQ
ncbi:MAG: malonyl-ACP O-methyltransferase BioC [Gammaproteobacteria bacterium]